MGINKLSLSIGMSSIIWIIFSGIRWFLLYPDYSQAIISVGVGIILVGFAYLYNEKKINEENIKDLNSGIDTFNIWVRDKFVSLRKELNLPIDEEL